MCWIRAGERKLAVLPGASGTCPQRDRRTCRESRARGQRSAGGVAPLAGLGGPRAGRRGAPRGPPCPAGPSPWQTHPGARPSHSPAGTASAPPPDGILASIRDAVLPFYRSAN